VNKHIVLAYQTGTLKPTTDTLRMSGKTHYAVSGTGAWVRITPKPSKKRVRF
jgi:hypothetical protein